jgi:serine/threonine protein kinase
MLCHRFSEVFEGKYLDQKYAVKRYQADSAKEAHEMRKALAEIAHFSSLDHPNVAKYICVAYGNGSSSSCCTDGTGAADAVSATGKHTHIFTPTPMDHTVSGTSSSSGTSASSHTCPLGKTSLFCV